MLLARLTSLSGSDISEVGQDFFLRQKRKWRCCWHLVHTVAVLEKDYYLACCLIDVLEVHCQVIRAAFVSLYICMPLCLVLL